MNWACLLFGGVVIDVLFIYWTFFSLSFEWEALRRGWRLTASAWVSLQAWGSNHLAAFDFFNILNTDVLIFFFKSREMCTFINSIDDWYWMFLLQKAKSPGEWNFMKHLLSFREENLFGRNPKYIFKQWSCQSQEIIKQFWNYRICFFYYPSGFPLQLGYKFSHMGFSNVLAI